MIKCGSPLRLDNLALAESWEGGMVSLGVVRGRQYVRVSKHEMAVSQSVSHVVILRGATAYGVSSVVVW